MKEINKLFLVCFFIIVVLSKSPKLKKERVDYYELTYVSQSTLSKVTQNIQQKLISVNQRFQAASLARVSTQTKSISVQDQSDSNDQWLIIDEDFQAEIQQALEIFQKQFSLQDTLFKTPNSKGQKITKHTAKTDQIAQSAFQLSADSWQQMSITNTQLQEVQKQLIQAKYDYEQAKTDLYAAYSRLTIELESRQAISSVQQEYLSKQLRYFDTIQSFQIIQMEQINTMSEVIIKQKEVDAVLKKVTYTTKNSNKSMEKKKSKKKLRKEKN